MAELPHQATYPADERLTLRARRPSLLRLIEAATMATTSWASLRPSDVTQRGVAVIDDVGPDDGRAGNGRPQDPVRGRGTCRPGGTADRDRAGV